MKNAFVIVTLSGLLSACAVAPTQHAPLEQARIEPMPVSDLAPVLPDEDSEDAPAEDPTLPKVLLTKDLLYRLLKAEFDVREGNWQAGFMTMMGVAQQTRDPRLARRAAEIALQARQSGESMAAVRLWRELAPESEEAAQYYLGLAVLADDLTEAERIFTRRLEEASPKARPMAMHQAQQYLARARDKAAAASVFERLLAPYADTFEARVLLSQNAFARGDSAAALKLAQAAMAQRPDSEIAALTLAQASPEGSQADVLATFLQANPGAREVRSAHARLLVSQKQYAEARKQFEALLKEQPDHTATLYAAGLISMQLSDPAGAERYFARFIEAHDNNPGDERQPGKVLLILAQLAEERGDHKAAARWLEKVEDSDAENFLSAQIGRAQLLAKQGDSAGARALLAAFKTEEPTEQARILLTQAQILREAGQLEAAYTLLADGAKRYPSNPDLLYDFALIAEKTGRLDIMETTLRAVMAQAPDNHHAYNALGYSLAERNVRLPEALALIDKALKMAPGDPFIMDSMGWVHYRMGNLDEAEAHLRRAYALRNDVEIAVHLGEVLFQKGLKADAHKLWREARAKDPKNDTLKSTLARLHQSL